jgi:4'-phosphopantetheinyl transferase
VFFNSSVTKQQLLDNEIHLWSINPQQITAQEQLKSIKSLLSQDELEKVQRYRLAKAQHNALITRAFVRSLLALYTGQKAQDIEFTITEHGKPELANSALPIRFNLSHNNELIICALCLNNDIGCDVESLYRKISVNNIAERYFSADEYQSLQTLPDCKRQIRFFEYWTLKEAFVKATGLGISQGLNTFSFRIGEAKQSTFNDNIVLQHANNNPLQNDSNWYSCLSYPDKTHCIAICMKTAKDSKTRRVKQFNANNYLL